MLHLKILAILIFLVSMFLSRRSLHAFQRLKEASTTKIQLYRSWLTTTFLFFGCFGTYILYDLSIVNKHKFSNMYTLIHAPYNAAFRSINKSYHIDFNLGSLYYTFSTIIGFTISIIIIVFIAMTPKGKISYCIEAISSLHPKTRSETFYLVLLCINAALSEEIMFRGALPSLLYTLNGNALAAILIPSIIFSIMRGYQGLWGFLLTFLLSILFSIILGIGFSLYIVMFLHFFLNIITLFVMPRVLSWKH